MAPFKAYADVQTLLFPAEEQNELPQKVMWLDGWHALSRHGSSLQLLYATQNTRERVIYGTEDSHLWSENTQVGYDSWNGHDVKKEGS